MPVELHTLRKLPLFSFFKEDEALKEFVAGGNWAKYKNGDIIYHVGEAAHLIYIIGSGKVRIVRNKTNLTMLGAGGVFGEIGPLLNIDRTVTAISIGDTFLFSFNAALLGKVALETRYEIMKYLYAVSTQRFLEATRKLSA